MASEEFPLWAVLHDSVSVLFPQICGVTRWGKRMYGDTSELMIATMVAVVETGGWCSYTLVHFLSLSVRLSASVSATVLLGHCYEDSAIITISRFCNRVPNGISLQVSKSRTTCQIQMQDDRR